MEDLKPKRDRREQQREYRAANLESIRAKNRIYKAANREAILAKGREYARERYAADPEKFRERERQRRAADPEAARERQRAYKAENKEKMQQRDREYRAANIDRARQRKRQWRAANPGRENQYYAANIEKYREASRIRNGSAVNRNKGLAIAAIAWRIKTGQIRRPELCSECKGPCRPDGHHDDYAMPLDIRWLCRSCHKMWHAVHGEAPNGAAPWYYPTAKRYKLRKKALRAIIAALPQNKEKQLSLLTKEALER